MKRRESTILPHFDRAGRQPQHAVHGLLRLVAKVEEEADEKPILVRRDVIQHRRAENCFPASCEGPLGPKLPRVVGICRWVGQP
jgi:hypothetical protein